MNKSPRNYSKDRYSNPPTDRNDRFQREQRDNRDSRETPERERDTRDNDNRSYRRDDDTNNQRNQRGDNRSNYNSSNSGSPNRNRNNNRYGSDRKNPASNFYDTPIRLNRLIAMSGFCSRRKADEFIESGSVKVNGIVVTDLGVKVHPREDRVEFKGQVIKPERPVYIILNKPKNAITTVTDPEGRLTVMDFVRNVGNFRIFPVGRLDRNTTGLLLMTNDGEMARVLTHPSYEISKVYRVLLDKELSQGDLRKLLTGLDLEDGVAKIDKIAFSEKSTERSEVLVQIHSGRNRVIRRMFEALGYSVRSLDRISFGPLTKKNVARGRWRYLTPKEVSFLKMTTATAKRHVGGRDDGSFADDQGYGAGDTEYNPAEEYNFLPEGGGSEDFDFDFNQYADGQSSDDKFSESELDALNEMAYEEDSEYNSASFQQSREQREKQAAQRTQRRPFQNRTQNTGGRTHTSYPPRDNNNRGTYGGPRSNNRNTYGGPRDNNSSSGDRPNRPYQNRENNYSSGDRPSRPYQNRENNYSSGDRPNRPYQNRENNYSSGDRPNRPYQNRENNYSSGDRPNRPYQNRENNYSSGDRPNRPYQNRENYYSSGDRPNRPYQNRENYYSSGDRPNRPYQNRENNFNRSEGDNRNSGGGGGYNRNNRGGSSDNNRSGGGYGGRNNRPNTDTFTPRNTERTFDRKKSSGHQTEESKDE